MVLWITGAARILLAIDTTDTLPKKYITTGSVKRAHVNVGRKLCSIHLDLHLKHFGKNIKPTVELDESKNPISCITKGLSTINTVIQKRIKIPFETSLPSKRAKKYMVLIVEARTIEDENPEKNAKNHIRDIFNIYIPLPCVLPNTLSTKDANSATLYPDADTICDNPDT